MLKVSGLCARCEESEILKGIDIEVKPGQIHAIMGPNGSGKSTFAKVLAGYPEYEVTGGSVSLDGTDLLELEPAERALAGLFLGFQYPVEIPGVTNFQLLFAAYKARHGGQGDESEFKELVAKKAGELGIDLEFIDRDVNCGFSGGEKKRNEILQMVLADPKVAVLDETDSGLDIDAMRHVAEGINHFMREDKGLILITHYQRLLDYIKPDVVHVMKDGLIQCTGSSDLAHKLEAEGYAFVQEANV